MRYNAIFCALLFSISGALQAGKLVEDAARYVDQLIIDLPVSDKLYCAPASRKFNTAYPQADYLLNVASAENIVVFVHGFVAETQSSRYSLAEMVDIWRYHIDLLEEIDSSTSYCVVTWDTEYGFDDKDVTLGRFLSALELAIRDTRLDKERKNITLVGHSAGGNYIKYSYLYLNGLRAQTSKVNIPTLTKDFKFHVVTLSTPHLGTKADNKTKTGDYIAQIAGFLLGDSSMLLSSLHTRKSQSRGAQQLKAIEFNEPLYQLNRSFSKIFPKSEIFAIGSNLDSTVSLISANPSFTNNYQLDFKHRTFLQPFKSGSLSSFLKIIYQGGHPRRKSND